MMQPFWFDRLRSALNVRPRFARGQRRARVRSHHFEKLEDRLVMAVTPPLLPGAVDDSVVVVPGAQINELLVSPGPQLVGPQESWLATFGNKTLFQTVGTGLSIESDRFYAVDVMQRYSLVGWAKSGDEFGERFNPENLQSFGLVSYDADLLPILPQHSTRFAGSTDTTLAAPLNPGDLVIQLTDATGWSRDSEAGAATRALAWFGYQDSAGTTYADYTYTRNLAMGGEDGLWAANAISGNVITLTEPWNGPALAAGTAVRNPGDGKYESFVVHDFASVPGDWTWTQYADGLGGGVQTGDSDPELFRPGTAFVKPRLVFNEHGGNDNFVSWRDVTLTPLPAAVDAPEFARPTADLSLVTGTDQQYLLPMQGSSSYVWSNSFVKIDTGQEYTLSGRGFNDVQDDLHLIGFASYDVDQKLIHPLHVSKHAFAADTILALDVSPGAPSIYIQNASGWSNEAWESAESRSLAWYGYTDSTGQTYADYTYTRNVAYDFDEGLWDAGDIHYDKGVGAYRIDLRNPWSGPFLGAGSAVRNATSGSTFQVPEVAPPQDSAGLWFDYMATFGGSVWQNGQRDDETFRPGTVYVQPVFGGKRLWTDVIVAPANSTATSMPLQAGANRQVELDLDVLGKGAIEGAPVVIDTASAEFGTVTIVSGAGPGGRDLLRYESADWFVGMDLVTYTIRSESTHEVQVLTVAIEVTGGNHEQDAGVMATLAAQAQVVTGNAAPVATDDFYTAVSGQELLADGIRNLGILSNDSDPTNLLVVRLVDGPDHGALALNFDGTFVYTPAAGFTGVDTFRYEVFDGLNVSTAVAMVSVRPSAEDLLLNRLEEIGRAMLNYESAYNRFPITNTASYFDATGNPYLSWRVHILPQLGFQELYDEFHLDEPWNSAHNLPLAAKMPDVFRSLGDAADSTVTRFQVLSGEGAPYYWRRSGNLLVGPRPSDITDGLAHSMLFAEKAADRAVTWTKPDALDFDPTDPLAAFGDSDIHAVMADGKSISLLPTIDSDTFKALVTVSGGEIVDAHTLRRQYAEANGGAPAVQAFAMQNADDYFRQIAIAVLNYEDRWKKFPGSGTPETTDENGDLFVSWRVQILDELGYGNLYDQFVFTEPWDSPNNLPLLSQMPDIYRSFDNSWQTVDTRIQAVIGREAAFGAKTAGGASMGFGAAAIRDGMANTLMFVEAGSDKAVPWTQWAEVPLNKTDPLPALGDLSGGEMRAAFLDASQSLIPDDITSEEFAALVTRQGSPLGGAEILDVATMRSRQLSRTGQLGFPEIQKDKFRELALAILNFEDAQQRLPANIVSTDGTPLLSWRMRILPYLELDGLYDQFHLDEPWDSPHNLALLKYMPDVFRGLGDSASSATTRVSRFTGPGAPFSETSNLGPRLNTISDGTSNTIGLVESGDGNAAPWTKPTDTPFNPNNPFSALGELGLSFLTAMLDGSAQTRSTSISLAELTALITNQGGEDVSNPPLVTNVPGFYIHQTAGNTQTNEFGVDAFDVVLDKAPVANVVLSLAINNSGIALLDKDFLTFTPENWNVPQRVAVRAIDNHVRNPDRFVQVSIGVVPALSDNSYHGVAAQQFSAVIVDDDLPQIVGDFNGNGHVNSQDLAVWQKWYGKPNVVFADGDADEDGDVDGLDFLAWQRNAGQQQEADFDLDEDVDRQDLGTWEEFYGVGAGADADGDGDSDGLDFLAWQRNVGIGVAPATGGDFDGDTQVGAADLGIWEAAYGVSDSGDADGDGDSDGLDFLAWQRNFVPPMMVASVQSPVERPSVMRLAVSDHGAAGSDTPPEQIQSLQEFTRSLALDQLAVRGSLDDWRLGDIVVSRRAAYDAVADELLDELVFSDMGQ